MTVCEAQFVKAAKGKKKHFPTFKREKRAYWENRTSNTHTSSSSLKHWGWEESDTSQVFFFFFQERGKGVHVRWASEMVSARKMIYSQLSQTGEDIPKKTRYFDPKTCFLCIVVAALYPSSLGGVYQPGRTDTRKTVCPRSLFSHNHFWSKINMKHLPFFSWICTRDLYDCCALARLYWFWKTNNAP